MSKKKYNPYSQIKRDYKLPFFQYSKTTYTDSEGDVDHVDKSFRMYTDVDNVLVSATVVGVTAGAINAICNGVSHLIYSIKKKK